VPAEQWDKFMSEDDRIGYIGQNEFATLCEREKLLASRPDPDRTGKDFIVEWKPMEGEGLDTRPPPRKCLVQIKSTRSRSKRVKIKLSAAEWLAKDLTPAFVIAPIIDEQESVSHYYGFHIAGDLLGRILTQLRQAAANGKKPHRLDLDLSLSTGVRLDANEVRAWMEAEAGDDMAQYASEKSLALKTLGYDDEGAEYTVTFSAGSVSEIVECLMGERELEARIGKPRRTRFGIPAEESGEYELPPTGRVSISPIPGDKWQAEVLNEAGVAQAAILMNGNTVAFENLPREAWRSEATNGLIAISIAGNRVTVSFRAAAMLEDLHDLDELIGSVEFWLALAACDGRIRILRNGSYSPTLKISSLPAIPDPVFARSLELLTAVRRIYDYCGIKIVEVNYSRLAERAEEIISSAGQLDLRQQKEPWIVIDGPPDQMDDLADRFGNGATLLIASPVVICGDVLAIAIGYSVRLERDGTSIRLHAVSRFPLRGQPLNADDPASDYKSFCQTVCEEVSPNIRAITPLATGEATS
jgi:hypothetical protein